MLIYASLAVPVDPQRDTLQQLREYSAGKRVASHSCAWLKLIIVSYIFDYTDFHPTIEYLTGTKDQVKETTKAYRVYV